ncbi:PREDICTED: uncharacterized protein LOC104818034 [Tarenaya hassleriana]|uniref:uncharacterized protein LOC104818034 n=1 Tax=Tarenaya hassleriana TaxID=28532 RepID=UPI00053C3918|nr:PREDICTED: uncharacterized protein LOC104818034 [Tarenaya hassleriana]
MKESAGNLLHLTSVNHVSLVCRCVEKSIEFYQNVLGFSLVRRPRSLDSHGAWLFGHGIGIHLLQSEDPENVPSKKEINPKDNHISFQCESMGRVEKELERMGVKYVHGTVEEGSVHVDQLFFHDPNGFMIEICNCDSFPLVPETMRTNRSRANLLLRSMPPTHPIQRFSP